MAPKPSADKKVAATAAPEGAAPQTSRATSYDVAMEAGVSQSAVSRCFQPGASISSKMRTRVMRAAKKLGYSPNAIARSLITRRSNQIAVIISNLTNLYYPEVLAEISADSANSRTRMPLALAIAEISASTSG